MSQNTPIAQIGRISEPRSRGSAGPPPETSPSHGFEIRDATEQNDRDPAIMDAVRLAQAGDMEAIDFLYLRYKNSIYGYVLSIMHNEYDAEDVTQHVFLKLISVIGSYERRRVPFTAWVIRVARNVAVDHLRQRRPVPVEEVFAPSVSADDTNYTRRSGLAQALDQLPQDQRNVVVLRHVVGLSPGEIGIRMGRTEASIHGLHHRARRALRDELVRTECAPNTPAASG
jgi:RNA polymerase sigma-70 factor, ECF subfamily